MTHYSPDTVLMGIALVSYSIAALALIGYFFTRQPLLQSIGAPLAVLGCASQFAQLIARFEMTGVWPLLNLYGSLSLFAAMGVLIFIIFAIRYDLWFAGGFVVAIAALFLAYATTWNEGVMPAVPSLQSYWAKIHVPLVVTSYGGFMVAFVLSSLYLVRYYVERATARTAALAAAAGTTTATATAGWLAAMPSLPQLDVLTYRAVAIGLPLLTLGIITGAMWAHEAWGAYWQWDPKETAALSSWIIYAVYMHLHTRNSWKGLGSAWISFAGFFVIIFTYLGVNVWIHFGLHAYQR
jgi:cytochrome c-type biogenesis protein CcsB